MKPVITLMYHDVIPSGVDKYWSGFNSKTANAYKISEHEFEKQVQIAADFSKKSGKEIIFSFDDGGISAVRIIAPILDKNNIKGFFFIPTSFIGKSGFVSATDIKLLADNGHIIGSHSHTHPAKMNRMKYPEILREWQISTSILQEIISSPIEYASVPGGWYSRKVAKACAEADIKFLYNSEPRTDNPIVEGSLISGRFVIRAGISEKMLSRILNTKHVRAFLRGKWLAGQLVKSFY